MELVNLSKFCKTYPRTFRVKGGRVVDDTFLLVFFKLHVVWHYLVLYEL